MKLVFITVSSSKEPWCEQARELYLEKIGRFFPVEVVEIRSAKKDRGSQVQKKQEESEKILEKLKPNDFVFLCDENGKAMPSEAWADRFQKLMNQSTGRLVFIVGGAFGVNDEVKKASHQLLNLSPFVLNHLVAQVVLMEQVYRALTIIRGLPYHNA